MSDREKIKWTEHRAQTELSMFCRGKSHELIIPNFQAFPYHENDLVSITRAGLAHVFEIKCSRSDFLCEFGPGRATRMKANRLKTYEQRDPNGANYFWLVCPEKIIKSLDEIPEWAGIIWLNADRDPAKQFYRDHRIEREAPRLHSQKVTERRIKQIGSGLAIRYWNDRIHGTLNKEAGN